MSMKYYIIAIIIAAIVLCIFFSQSTITLHFHLDKDKRSIEGKVFQDNRSIGVAKDGILKTDRLKPGKMTYQIRYNCSSINISYNIEEDWLKNKEALAFTVPLERFREKNEGPEEIKENPEEDIRLDSENIRKELLLQVDKLRQKEGLNRLRYNERLSAAGLEFMNDSRERSLDEALKDAEIYNLAVAKLEFSTQIRKGYSEQDFISDAFEYWNSTEYLDFLADKRIYSDMGITSKCQKNVCTAVIVLAQMQVTVNRFIWGNDCGFIYLNDPKYEYKQDVQVTFNFNSSDSAFIYIVPFKSELQDCKDNLFIDYVKSYGLIAELEDTVAAAWQQGLLIDAKTGTDLTLTLDYG